MGLTGKVKSYFNSAQTIRKACAVKKLLIGICAAVLLLLGVTACQDDQTPSDQPSQQQEQQYNPDGGGNAPDNQQQAPNDQQGQPPTVNCQGLLTAAEKFQALGDEAANRANSEEPGGAMQAMANGQAQNDYNLAEQTREQAAQNGC